MLPVLFSAFGVPFSSFGVFLGLGFFVGVFLVWRLARAWDLDEEKILDLTLLTFFGGLIGARLYFGLEHPGLFTENFLRIILITKYPGFSFWGAILGGWLTLFFFSRAKKMDFAQVGDIASVGFLVSYILSDIGCFFGGCSVGIQSNLLSVNMVGFLGRRFPIQLLEAALLILVLSSIWSAATHFHIQGKIVSLSLIYVGLIKFLTEPLKQSHEHLTLSLVLFFLGLTLLYKVTKRNPLSDLKKLYLERKFAVARLKKYWYNKKTSIWWRVRNLKKILRRFNVRFS